MFANSSPVHSNQSSVHERLAGLVARHAGSAFERPIPDYSRAAFDAAIEAWDNAGRTPLIVDAGCGVGWSTLELASRFKDHFVIGVDRSADRLSRKLQWQGAMPSNQVCVRADMGDFWRLLHADRIRPARQYLLYPNPWPKSAHLGRRWHGHPVFPVMAALGGRFECRSNWRVYIDECAQALTQLGAGDVRIEALTVDTPLTPFERKYAASGHSLWRCEANLNAMNATIIE